MRKLVLKMSISLDGFVAGPNGEIDWIFRTVGGDSTGWIVGTEVDRTTRALADAKKDRSGDRRSVTPTAAVLKSWAEPMVARGDLAEEVARLKEQPGKFILAHGGARGSLKASSPPASSTNIGWSFIRLRWAGANRSSPRCAARWICD